MLCSFQISGDYYVLPCILMYPKLNTDSLILTFQLFFKIRSQFKEIQLILSFIARTFAALQFAGLLAPPDVQISLHRVERCRSGRFSTDPLGGMEGRGGVGGS